MIFFIYLFVTGVGCETRYVGTTKLKNITNISARVTYINAYINAQIKELDALFPGGEQIPNLKQPHFGKEKIYFKAVNNQ